MGSWILLFETSSCLGKQADFEVLSSIVSNVGVFVQFSEENKVRYATHLTAGL